MFRQQGHMTLAGITRVRVDDRAKFMPKISSNSMKWLYVVALRMWTTSAECLRMRTRKNADWISRLYLISRLLKSERIFVMAVFLWYTRTKAGEMIYTSTRLVDRHCFWFLQTFIDHDRGAGFALNWWRNICSRCGLVGRTSAMAACQP